MLNITGDHSFFGFHGYKVRFQSFLSFQINGRDRTELDKFGLKHDRKWLLVDGKNSFITQRQQTKMVLIEPEFDGGSIMLKELEMEKLYMLLKIAGGKKVTVEIF